MASFGPIDIDPASPAYGTFTSTPKPGWAGARFHDVLGQFGVPIAVDTDVSGAALGEWLKGAGQFNMLEMVEPEMWDSIERMVRGTKS